MDHEQSKRKVAESSEINESENIPGPSKMRKIDPPENPSTQPRFPTQPENRNNEGLGNSDLVKKLVTAWIGDSQEQHPLMMQESTREIIALRDCQERCCEAGATIQSFQQKIEAMESVIVNLKKAVKNEEKEKMNLVKEINSTEELTKTISDHINYITDTLNRCKQQKDHFSHLYKNVVLKQKRDDSTLKNRVKMLWEKLMNLRNEVETLNNCLITSNLTDEMKLNQMQRTFKVELANGRLGFEISKTRLVKLTSEKNKLLDSLAIASEATFALKKKINGYKREAKKLTDQIIRDSEDLRLLEIEKTQWGIELDAKHRDFVQAVENLESATKKITDLSSEILAIKKAKNELEEKLKYESNEREILSKSLHNQFKNLTHQVEHLKNSNDEDSMEIRKNHEKALYEIEKKKTEALDEAQREKEKVLEDMQKKIDALDKKKEKLVAKSNKDNEELKRNYERLLKAQEEKYTDCIAEMKTMEARQKCELSRANTSSSTNHANANAEKRKIERELDTLKSEKERLEVEYQQTEDSLMRLSESEKELQRKLNEAQSQASEFAESLAKKKAENKILGDEEQQRICKINELQKELDKLRFSNSKITPIRASSAKPIVNPDRNVKANSQKPKVVSSTSLKKPILKYTSKQRRTRSSPPSPILPQISANIMTPNSEALFDELIGKGTSASQPNSSVSSSQVSTGDLKVYQRRSNEKK